MQQGYCKWANARGLQQQQKALPELRYCNRSLYTLLVLQGEGHKHAVGMVKLQGYCCMCCSRNELLLQAVRTE